ncbi:MAG: amidohydrolase family protein [bacterium]|nr:amidohydrolase family protein [bacterium]
MPGSLIIDAHMHLYQTREQGEYNKAGYDVWEYGEHPDVTFSDRSGVPGEALEAMRRSGVSYAIVVNLFATIEPGGRLVELLPGAPGGSVDGSSHEIPLGDRLKSFNRWLVELGKVHEELLPFVAIDPWALSPGENQAHLADLVESGGARGVKIHPVIQRFEAADERLSPAFETCAELDLPVVAHAGPSRGSVRFGEPAAFAGVLQRFPRLKLVLAHLGGGAWRDVERFARDFPNAYFDCSEILHWTGAGGGPTPDRLAGLIRDIGASRVLFGSDFPWYDLDTSIEALDRLPLAEEEKAAIAGLNAARLLGISGES